MGSQFFGKFCLKINNNKIKLYLKKNITYKINNNKNILKYNVASC